MFDTQCHVICIAEASIFCKYFYNFVGMVYICHWCCLNNIVSIHVVFFYSCKERFVIWCSKKHQIFPHGFCMVTLWKVWNINRINMNKFFLIIFLFIINDHSFCIKCRNVFLLLNMPKQRNQINLFWIHTLIFW